MEVTASRRRTLFAAASAIVAGSGVTAGAAASVADLVQPELNTLLEIRRAQLTAAIERMGYVEVHDASDEAITAASIAMSDICRAVVETPLPDTHEARALKAAAAMHELRHGYGPGFWHDDGQAMAWNVLSSLAGAAYIPVPRPPELMATCEPPRET